MNLLNPPEGLELQENIQYRQWMLDPKHVNPASPFAQLELPPVMDYRPLSEFIRDLHGDGRLEMIHAAGLLMLFGLETPKVGPHLRSMQVEDAKRSAGMVVKDAVRDYSVIHSKPRKKSTLPDPYTFETARDYFNSLQQGLYVPMDKRMTLPRIVTHEQRFYSRQGIGQYVGNTAIAQHFIQGHLALLLDRVLPGTEEQR